MVKKTKRCMGISLAELLVVLAIVSTLALVGASAGPSKPRGAVKGLTEQLVSSLAEGRQWARTHGGRVVLHVRGTSSPTFALAFEGQDPASGATTTGATFSLAALDSAVRNHAAIGLGKAHLDQVAPDLTALKQVALVQDWADLLTDDHALFLGRESTATTFDASGTVSQDCFLTVSAVSPGPDSPLGLVVLTRTGGLHAFLKPSARDPWRAL